MSGLSSLMLHICKDIMHESSKKGLSKYNNGDTKNIVPLSQLNLLKKYPFEVKIHKIKQGYQMLVFFTEKGEKYLVYGTKRGDLELVTKEITPICLPWKKKPNYQITSIKFVNDEASRKFSNWCGKFRHGTQIFNESVEVRRCPDNF